MCPWPQGRKKFNGFMPYRIFCIACILPSLHGAGVPSIKHRIPRIHYLTILANNHHLSLSFRHGILLTPRPLKVHLASCSWDVLVFEFWARTLVLGSSCHFLLDTRLDNHSYSYVRIDIIIGCYGAPRCCLSLF